MAENQIKFKLDLQDIKALQRIIRLFNNFFDIQKIVNKDSEKSSEGGAFMYYEVDINFKEKWI